MRLALRRSLPTRRGTSHLGHVGGSARLGRRIRRRGPGRTMASDRILLEFGDISIGKTGEIVEILIIFPHVVYAEVEIFPFAHASDRRAMRAGLVTTVPLAARAAGLGLLRLFRADADTVEKFGVRGHRINYAD